MTVTTGWGEAATVAARRARGADDPFPQAAKEMHTAASTAKIGTAVRMDGRIQASSHGYFSRLLS